MSAGIDDAATVRIWSLPVRVFHWSLAASIALAWLAAEETRRLHELAGYAAVALVAWRLVAGLAGSRYTRFAQFVRSPRTVRRYLAESLRHSEPRYLGHNPAGGAMVLALLATIAAIALTGWMQTTDAYWGVRWVERVHEMLGNLIVALVALHVAGVLAASLRHRENLVLAMLTGRKRRPETGDVA